MVCYKSFYKNKTKISILPLFKLFYIVLKQLVSYILLSVYALIIISPAIPMVDYVVNYKHISQDLCENKDKPEMHCNGKCHLKKEIKKVMGDEHPDNKKTTLPVLKLKEYADYYRINLLRKYYFKLTFQQKKQILIIQKTFKGYLPDMIKPPPAFYFV